MQGIQIEAKGCCQGGKGRGQMPGGSVVDEEAKGEGGGGARLYLKVRLEGEELVEDVDNDSRLQQSVEQTLHVGGKGIRRKGPWSQARKQPSSGAEQQGGGHCGRVSRHALEFKQRQQPKRLAGCRGRRRARARREGGSAGARETRSMSTKRAERTQQRHRKDPGERGMGGGVRNTLMCRGGKWRPSPSGLLRREASKGPRLRRRGDERCFCSDHESGRR